MLYVVVPAYNEAKNIGRVVRDLFKIEDGFRQISDGFKLIVVDDGSTDDTARVARDAGATVLSHPINRGQGAALHTGNEYARRHGADIVVHFDGDGQFSSGDIFPAIEKLKRENLDIVLGSRFLDTRSKLPWSKRHLLLPMSRWIQNVLTGVKLTDVHNGFRVMNRRALDMIEIIQDGMAHNTEIISQIKKYNLRFAEYPVAVKYNEYGQGLRGGFRIMHDVLFSHMVKH
ncbi:MAG: glycosyltransferase family 2 protein [Candidatus Magasanikbacteria bacterium]|nr:glycosyltransferase family 2 protein [Candidatus Magasanikbacteria bacterium]